MRTKCWWKHLDKEGGRREGRRTLKKELHNCWLINKLFYVVCKNVYNLSSYKISYSRLQWWISYHYRTEIESCTTIMLHFTKELTQQKLFTFQTSVTMYHFMILCYVLLVSLSPYIFGASALSCSLIVV